MFRSLFNYKQSGLNSLKPASWLHLAQGMGIITLCISSQAFAATTSICSNNVADVGADLSHDVAAVFDSSKQTFDVMQYSSKDRTCTGTGTVEYAANDYCIQVPTLSTAQSCKTPSGTYNWTFSCADVLDGTAASKLASHPCALPFNQYPTITSNGAADTASVSLAENSTTVTSVTATEPDSGQVLSYGLNGGTDQGKFSINATTGALSFTAAPDFEAPADSDKNNSYQVIVIVTDNGNPNLSDTQTITVTVTDVDDNKAPTITSNGGGDTAAVSVAENNTAVTTVVATDADSGQTLSYSLTGGTDQAKFSINATTGALSFTAAPDFETPADSDKNNTYQVIVTATDSGTPAKTDTQTITVTVTDVDDNKAPTITSNGGGDTAAVSVAENNTAVTTVVATDADSSQTLSYSLTGGTDQAKFSIDSNTGALTFTAAPDFEKPTDSDANNTYQVIVTVTDSGKPAKTDTQTITVTVTNIDENKAPTITSNGAGDTAAISIPENSTMVTTVTATDPNSDTLSYSITGGTDKSKFTIDSKTGVLIFTTAPDFENPTDSDANNTYQVIVMVTDQAATATKADAAQTDSQTITVTVTDIQETAIPIFGPLGLLAMFAGLAWFGRRRKA